VSEKNRATRATLLERGSGLREGRADVYRHRERSRLKKVIRALVVVAVFDLLFWRWLDAHPEGFSFQLPPEWPIYLPAIVIVLAIVLMVCLPLMSGRSPHLVVSPEQVEIGLTELKGLDGQRDEVLRTLDVFLGYATFRDELGGTPRRGILFEGPPGTGKTFLAKAMAKEAGVPFLFIPAPAFTSMWQGMSAWRIRSFFKALRKLARKQGGAIGFIEEIDAIAESRSRVNAAPAPADLARTTSSFFGGGGDTSSMVNELLIQMQSFDQPRFRERLRGKFLTWLNDYLPPNRQLRVGRSVYHNILLIAATNRSESLDHALLRPGRFDRRLYFDVPTKLERRELIDFFMDRKAHHQILDEEDSRERIAHETFAYTPVMIEHLFDEALLLALRDGRREMNLHDVLEAKFTEEIGTKQPVIYTEADRAAVATHEAGHAAVAYFLSKGRRLEVLSIVKRRGALGLLAHSEEEERFTRTRSEIESGVAIALGGLVAEEMFLGESGTGPATDLAHATDLAAKMVGAFGMAGSLISYEAVAEGPIGRSNLVAKVLGTRDGKRRVEDILEGQRERVRAVLAENTDVHHALRDALIESDELVRDEILAVVQRALDARAS